MGKELAKELKQRLSLDELMMLQLSSEEFIDGFLIGRFSNKHSRVALYNASANWK